MLNNRLPFLSAFIGCIALLTPFVALAQFQPLVGIPGLDNTSEASLGEYANALYMLSISLAAILAVIRIIYGGVQYMFSEIVTDKSQGKQTIKNSLFGLLIVVSAALILNEINPQLTDLNFLEGGTGTTIVTDIESRAEAAASADEVIAPLSCNELTDDEARVTATGCRYDCSEQETECDRLDGRLATDRGCNSRVYCIYEPESPAPLDEVVSEQEVEYYENLEAAEGQIGRVFFSELSDTQKGEANGNVIEIPDAYYAKLDTNEKNELPENLCQVKDSPEGGVAGTNGFITNNLGGTRFIFCTDN